MNITIQWTIFNHWPTYLETFYYSPLFILCKKILTLYFSFTFLFNTFGIFTNPFSLPHVNRWIFWNNFKSNFGPLRFQIQRHQKLFSLWKFPFGFWQKNVNKLYEFMPSGSRSKLELKFIGKWLVVLGSVDKLVLRLIEKWTSLGWNY